MEIPSIFENKKVAVIGLGIEGKDAIKYLLLKGAHVTLLDKVQKDDKDFESIERQKIKEIYGDNYLQNLDGYDYIVRSPGVYRYAPELTLAEKQGVVITSPVKIFFGETKSKIIGVTGTKGKGTTSTLIYEILKAAGHDVFLVGNIGKPYLELLPILTPKSIVVMELSSFQLIDLGKGPDVAVVLNITQDHMDWHKNVEEYIDAKRNIVLNQTADDVAVINEDYKTPKSFAKDIKSKVFFFSTKKLKDILRTELLLRGKHNLENVAAACKVAEILGIEEEIIVKTVKAFKGLEHRLELVREVDGKTFYNDSFATGPQPTTAAISSFKEEETLILGGSDKGLDYGELAEVIANKKNVKNIILIGAIREQIANALTAKNYKGNILDMGTAQMTEIVKKAFEVTNRGGVIILSPAAASFDMFKNYKDRGNQFKDAVQNLSVGL